MTDALRRIPQVDALLRKNCAASLIEHYGRPAVGAELRKALQDVRARVLHDPRVPLPDFDEPPFWAPIETQLIEQTRPNLRRVINATGVVVHTNLGRSPLAQEAIDAISRAAGGYSNLEFDLSTGQRGSRYRVVEDLICQLTGAEAALVVNNCAAAVTLALAAHAAGGEVVVSRGELIEIGGSFRLPEVITQGGAKLREVGATNKTRLSDYTAATDEDTRVYLKSHTSNYRIVGFTAAPSRSELAEAAHTAGLVLIEDLGSGALVNLDAVGMADEPIVRNILNDGVDLVMFSGDKLLGGPQAGILAGTSAAVAALKSHPLLRALRIDKLSLAALEATLRLYLPPHDPLRDVPVLRMLSERAAQLQPKAARLAQDINDAGVCRATVTEHEAYAGGGALPQQVLDSWAVALTHDELTANALATRLRDGSCPVIGHIAQNKLHLDVRTVTDDDLPHLAQAVNAV